MTEKNLELWNKVCTTDPKYTKEVKLGRKFTAIDPMYQVMKATEFMGVVGEGWGFEVKSTKFLPTDQVAMKVRVWKDSREKYIEHWGQCGFYTDNAKTKVDTDCMKKATTDGITKCLSYFGFNADVFLGMFDNIEYVENLKNAVDDTTQKLIDDCRNEEDLTKLWNDKKGESRTKEQTTNFINACAERKEEILKGAKNASSS